MSKIIDPKQYREGLIKAIKLATQNNAQILALWEGGSAANGDVDKYSDVDLCILTDGPVQMIFDLIQSELETISSISHTWTTANPGWPNQKVYILQHAPTHFFVDLAVFTKENEKLLMSFMEIERHGAPSVFFDKTGLIISHNLNESEWLDKRKKRLDEVTASFPIYKIEVLKELDRGNAIDAFGFYMHGLVRPLAEVLGMIHRPFKFDFGLRYFHRSFPADLQNKIESLCYVSDAKNLRQNLFEIEALFYESASQVRIGFKNVQ